MPTEPLSPRFPGPTADRIIDKDIEAYTGFLEEEQSRLRRCVPSREAHHRARIQRIGEVLVAMHAYRTVIDEDAESAGESRAAIHEEALERLFAFVDANRTDVVDELAICSWEGADARPPMLSRACSLVPALPPQVIAKVAAVYARAASLAALVPLSQLARSPRAEAVAAYVRATSEASEVEGEGVDEVAPDAPAP
jgi:hypothetical protein